MSAQYLVARRLQLAFAAAIITLLIVGVFSYRGIVASSEGEKWVSHTHAVLDNLQELQVSMEGLESASRGYLLTADDEYLMSYQDSSTRVAQYETSLRQIDG